jgi:hypothetical protein
MLLERATRRLLAREVLEGEELGALAAGEAEPEAVPAGPH